MGWGSSTRRGGGRKVRALPRKFVFLGFRREESGMSPEFCLDVPDPWGCSKSLCKKSSCAFFVPQWTHGMELGLAEILFSLWKCPIRRCVGIDRQVSDSPADPATLQGADGCLQLCTSDL